ncbi:hypothetical protein C5167_014172 [Papaver somniferum]|uniref:Sec20 C-terminal domain-containing protein n=1 Tax=Papaver somniferum TaxID=3469 RepID=A0A4Y7J6F8_PAPSO|nr:hypothetical protein C5167_014172 [Papaver somniferum]
MEKVQSRFLIHGCFGSGEKLPPTDSRLRPDQRGRLYVEQTCKTCMRLSSGPHSVIMDDEVTQAVEKVIKEWEETSSSVENNVKAIQKFGTSVDGMTKEKNSHQRLNGLAQDGLALLRSLQFKLDLLAQQLLTEEQVQSAHSTLTSWKDQYQRLFISVSLFVWDYVFSFVGDKAVIYMFNGCSLHLGLRNANLQAQTNMRKAAQTKRELLLGGGEECTIRRRNLQTKAGITNASESITESLRRTRQLMVQEVERSENILATFDESTGVLKKAESEYKGHRSLLMRTKNLLSTMRRQDVVERLILFGGCFMFSCAVFYVVSKRIGVFLLLRKVTEAMKAGTIVPGDLGAGVAENGFNGVRIDDNGIPNVEVPPLEMMRDEL